MRTIHRRRGLLLLSVLPVAGWLLLGRADAHCDALDGPVIQDARVALRTKELTPVLKWLAPETEAEVRAAFDDALVLREFGERPAVIGEQRFFETLVRLHRAGEGAGFTGLKPAGQIEPVVQLADQALGEGSPDALIAELQEAVARGVRQRFDEAKERRIHRDESVEAGRAYVASYVELMHYLESLHDSATGHETADGEDEERHP